MQYTEVLLRASLKKKTVDNYTEVLTSCFSARNFQGALPLEKETVK